MIKLYYLLIFLIGIYYHSYNITLSIKKCEGCVSVGLSLCVL